MKSKHLNLFVSLLFSFFYLGLSSALSQGNAPWEVPEKFQKMKNPTTNSSESIETGKALYTKHCASCHGKKGLGDGSKAAQLKTKCGNFSKADFQSQTDGSIFYKTVEGRDDMPSFKKKIPDAEEVWHIVNYMRTLKG